ncbi:MAG: hypothetical protein ACREOH_08540 [Candidatus Entotheonellia bacterium]
MPQAIRGVVVCDQRHQMLALRCAKYNGTLGQLFARYRQRIHGRSR